MTNAWHEALNAIEFHLVLTQAALAAGTPPPRPHDTAVPTEALPPELADRARGLLTLTQYLEASAQGRLQQLLVALAGMPARRVAAQKLAGARSSTSAHKRPKPSARLSHERDQSADQIPSASAPCRKFAPERQAVGGGSQRGQTLSPSLDDLLLRAATSHQRGDLTAAESACRQVLSLDPGESRAVQILGAILAERGDVELAVDLFEPAAERLGAPSTITFGFYNNYANALRLTKRNEEADGVLRQLVALAPREWQPWHNLGEVLKDMGRYDEAVSTLRRAVAFALDYGPNHGVLGEVLHKLGRLRSADVALRKCIGLGWDSDVNRWTILGNNYRMLGELSESVECLERAFVRGNVSASCSRRADSTRPFYTSAPRSNWSPRTASCTAMPRTEC